MGCFSSKTVHNIDQPLNLPTKSTIKIENFDFNQFDIKVLLLGTGESGKTTFLRQIKRLYCGGFSDKERKEYKILIKKNIIYDFKTIISTLKRSTYKIESNYDEFIEIIENLDPSDEIFEEEIYEILIKLWDNPIFQVQYEESKNLGISENLVYYINKLKIILQNNYIPNDQYILNIRIRTTGISNLKFKVNDIKTELFDVGGQVSERKRWELTFSNVNILLFVCSLSDYDQLMFEDLNKNRSLDSIEVFERILQVQHFQNIPIFLLLNKFDIFEKKIKNDPQKFLNYYSDFNGNINDINEIIEFIKNKYLFKIKNSILSNIKVYITCAVNDEDIKKFINSLAETIILNKKKKNCLNFFFFFYEK